MSFVLGIAMPTSTPCTSPQPIACSCCGSSGRRNGGRRGGGCSCSNRDCWEARRLMRALSDVATASAIGSCRTVSACYEVLVDFHAVRVLWALLQLEKALNKPVQTF